MRPEISATAPAGHLHEPFLERASCDAGHDGQYALAGFLTLRLVDQFDTHRLPPHPDAIAYQCTATRDFLAEFGAPSIEVNHLLEIVCVADRAREKPGRGRMLFPPLLAFAYWLERESRLHEALDVLDTALRLSADGPRDEEVQCWLQRGRVLRRIPRFDEATASYVVAGNLAAELADGHSELLSRIGRGIVLQRLGNLPESERLLQNVLEDARKRDDHDAEARASHDLANTLGHMGRYAEGIPLLYRAYLRYEQPLQKLRALSDLGILFKEGGRLDAADDAFTVVVHGEVPPDVQLNAALELMEVNALRGNQIAFERWRRVLAKRVLDTPYEAVDYSVKAGIGAARFGNRHEAERHWRDGLEVAERCGFNQYVFRLEQLLRHLSDSPGQEVVAKFALQRPDVSATLRTRDVQAVADSVQLLRGVAV